MVKYSVQTRVSLILFSSSAKTGQCLVSFDVEVRSVMSVDNADNAS